jgi:hypothetical protein
MFDDLDGVSESAPSISEMAQ